MSADEDAPPPPRLFAPPAPFAPAATSAASTTAAPSANPPNIASLLHSSASSSASSPHDIFGAPISVFSSEPSVSVLTPSPSALSSSFPLASLSDSSEDDHVFSAETRSAPRSIRGARTSFILGDKLGDGAFATVREAIDENTLRIVAVKVIDTRRARKLRGGLDAITREVAVQKRLAKHPNLIHLVDVIKMPSRNRVYIVLELANGCTVEELAAHNANTLPPSQVAHLMYHALCALQYMHGRGVVHRDIKPANLMLTAAGVLKISDFGVAEFLNEYNDDDNVSRTSGSPAFQAPEIATGEINYSGRKVDVWALGVTTYLLLTGNVPFSAESIMGLFDSIGQGVYTEPDWFDDSLRDVIRKMLTVDWRQRISVDELLKHPWMARGAAELSQEERDAAKWVPVPRRKSSIMDVIKQMYKTDEAGVEQSTAVPTANASAPASENTAGDQEASGMACVVS